MALFDGTPEEFRKFVPVTINFNMPDVMPDLETTEATLLPKFLGDGVTEQLQAMSDRAESELSAEEKRALRLARTFVARIGFAGYLPFAEVQIGNDGVTVSANQNRKAAFEYQTLKLERKLLEIGWGALDELISLVDRHRDIFPDWVDSPYFQEHQDALFKTPAEFSRYYPIQDKWLTYWSLRPFIRAMEEERGQDGLERIDQLPDAVTTSQKEMVRRKLLRALAYQSVIEALPNLSVELNGVNVQVNYASQYGNAQYYQAPTKDQLQFVLSNLQKQTELAWQTFDTALQQLTPVDESVDPEQNTGTGILSSGAVTMI